MKDIYSYFYDLRFSYYFYSNHLDFIIHMQNPRCKTGAWNVHEQNRSSITQV